MTPDGLPSRVGVAVPAAGMGRRMGGVRKPFLELAGEPVLMRSLRPFLAQPDVVAVVVALGPDEASRPPGWLTDLDPRIRVVPGGRERGDSVRRAIEALPADVDVIAVHDAARPLVRPEVVRSCFDVATAGEGAVAGCRSVDTIKRVDGDDRVVGTADRTALWLAQTPQVFPAELLRRAYAAAGEGATDDSALVEALGAGVRIRMVDAGPGNLKVTRPGDLALAEALLSMGDDR